jgi:hypothetical protein
MVIPSKTCIQCGRQLGSIDAGINDAICKNCEKGYWKIEEKIAYHPELTQLTEDRAQEFVSDSSNLHLVSMAKRVGWSVFTAAIEHRLFHPCSILNDAFQVMFVLWNDQLYQVVSMPVGHLEGVEKFAQEFELRITENYPALVSIPGTPITMAISIPVKYIEHKENWALDRMQRLLGKRLPRPAVDMFPLWGPTLRAVEATLDATGKYRDFSKEIQKIDEIKKETEWKSLRRNPTTCFRCGGYK